jgi:FAD/FMN-containing dehydrogenase
VSAPPVRRDQALRSWGRVQRDAYSVVRPQFMDQLDTALPQRAAPRLAIGARRSYGDTALSRDALLIDMTGLDRLIAFDPATGVLTAEAGVMLADVMAAFAPRGWFPPVTPGTRFVTLGGAVANDVHGKNHHSAGTFGRHVTGLKLERSDTGLIDLSPRDPLFGATIGGLGLTGVIRQVSLKLQPIASSWLAVQTLPLTNLDDFFAISADSEAFEHTVAWIDCTASGSSLGRGVFTRADWLRDGRLEPHKAGGPNVPMDAPAWLLNPVSLKAFNRLYRWSQLDKPRLNEAHYAAVFHPLDAIGGWNRLYGPAGFYQYQCVTPQDAGPEPIRRMLQIVAASGEGSTLAVLKAFGDVASPGLMSFPQPGFTLALDFANHGDRTLQLMGRLDEVVAGCQGRLYPAKDGRMRRDLFEAGYPNLARFRTRLDPACRSDFSMRMGL